MKGAEGEAKEFIDTDGGIDRRRPRKVPGRDCGAGDSADGTGQKDAGRKSGEEFYYGEFDPGSG